MWWGWLGLDSLPANPNCHHAVGGCFSLAPRNVCVIQADNVEGSADRTHPAFSCAVTRRCTTDFFGCPLVKGGLPRPRFFSIFLIFIDFPFRSRRYRPMAPRRV
jgi:hypothetical protein